MRLDPKTRPESDIFAELELLCASPGYAHAIAMFCFRDNSVGYGSELTADDLQKLHSRSRLVRTEIATLIGLMVRHPLDLQQPGSHLLQQYIDKTESLLEELHNAMLFSGIDVGNWAELLKTGKNPFSNGPALREPIFYGGESAYTFQYSSFSMEKYRADDAWLSGKKGFTIKDAVHFAATIANLLGERQLSHLKSLRLARPETWTMLPGFMFSAAEVSEAAGLSIETTDALLLAFSLPSNERNACFTSINEFNTSCAQPILFDGTSQYILFQYYSLVESIYESPFYWMCADHDYRDSAMSHRGEYTESLTESFLLRLFRAESVFKNVRLFKGKDEVGEIDNLAVLGPYAVLFQAKSKRLTVEARKGNDKQIKDDFRRAVQDAVDQATVCANGLLDADMHLVDAQGDRIRLTQPIKLVYPVSVVSDHYPALAFQARRFLQTKSQKGIAKPLVTDVFALDAMTEMLPSPLYFVSYLHRRDLFGEKVMAMHEHTLLSCYLKYNLWVDEEHNLVMFEDDISVHLDAAMAVRREGLPGAREPDGILTRIRSSRVGDLIRQIETENTEAPIDLGVLLLELSEEAVKMLDKGMSDISAAALRDSKIHDITIPLPSAGLTLHSSSDVLDRARAKLASHCKLCMYRSKANRWFGLVLNPSDGKIRAGLKIDSDWKPDPFRDAQLNDLKSRGVGKAVKMVGSRRKKIGRNDPCICGSGKKYKKCCGSIV